ncbi:ArnT family glycosyltransferase [Patescibacteria group bacterium]
MKFRPLNQKFVIILSCFFCLAFFLRFFQTGQPVFKEDENTTVSAAAYLYYCQQDSQNCYYQPETFRRKLTALLTNNQTRPNLITPVYLWDWIKDQPSPIHYSRAWPHLFGLSFLYQHFGISQFSSRIISVFSGSLLIIIGFAIARLINLSPLVAFIYSLILVFSPHLITVSRNARMYSFFSLAFMLTIYCLLKWFKTKKNSVLIMSLFFFGLAYFLHSLALIVPVSLLIFSLIQSVIKKRPFFAKIAVSLIVILLVITYLFFTHQLNIFPKSYLAISSQPHWSYLHLVFGGQLIAVFGFIIIFVSFKKIKSLTPAAFIAALLIVDLLILVFFSNFSLGSAYVIHLLPLAYLLIIFCLKDQPKLRLVFFALVLLSLLANLKSLYLPPYDRPQLPAAYKEIINRIKPQDQVIGYLVRDYYLKDLPASVSISKLSKNQFSDLIPLINQSLLSEHNLFIIFEQEKTVYLNFEQLDFLNQKFIKIAGQGLDDYQVEIYARYNNHND